MSDDANRTEDSQLDALLATVEQIRSARFPDVPSDLVKSLLLAHADAGATDTELIRKLEQAVEDAISQGD